MKTNEDKTTDVQSGFLIFFYIKKESDTGSVAISGCTVICIRRNCFCVCKNKTKYDVRAVSMVITSLMILILGLIPADIDIVIGLFPTFFAMAFQWNSFPGEYGYVSSTIFSTNNTRQVSLALGEILFPDDGKKGIEAKERNKPACPTIWYKSCMV